MSLNLTQFIGQSALIVSLVTGIFGVFFGLYITLARPNILSKQFTMLRVCGVILVTTIAMACGMLVICLLTDDFSLLYVVEHSSSQMQTPYKLAAFYSGQAGSLLIWSLVIAIGLLLQNFSTQSSEDALTHTILSVIVVLFLIPLVWLDSPFASSSGDFTEGIGLNPLLVDPTMLIHPPMLLTGLASTGVPFALAFGAIIRGKNSTEDMAQLRKWSLISLLVLSAGNFLGAWWAYTVLGWGGYWGWDPVENCALLPLLPLVTFLHLYPIYKRSGAFKNWILIATCMSFALAIFGTFNVRSGLIASVHSFAQSEIGPYFLGLLGLALLAPLVVAAINRPDEEGSIEYQSFSSRETGLIFNNFLMVAIGLVIFGATIFPVVTEILNGARVVVGPPFFVDTVGPLLVVLLVLLSVTVHLLWGNTPKHHFIQEVRLPSLLALLGLVTFVVYGLRGALGVTSVFFALLIIGGHVQTIFTGSRETLQTSDKTLITSTMSLMRRYGGYFAHVGLAIMALGIIGSSIMEERARVIVSPGEQFIVGSYAFEYTDLWGNRPSVNGIEIEAGTNIEMREPGSNSVVDTLRPGRRFFFVAPDQPVSIVDINSNLLRDVYVFTQGWNEEKAAEIQIIIKPLVQWLWIGAGIYIAGLFLCFTPEKKIRAA